MSYKKIVFLLILLILVIAGFFSIFSFSNSSKKSLETLNPEAKTLKVSVTFYPTFEFSKAIGQNLVSVVNITPSGLEPHDYEPSAKQISEIFKSDLFIFNGGNLDPWAKKLEPDLKSENVKSLEIVSNFESSPDPHVWLDPILAQKEVNLIKDLFIQADPKNTEIYINNAETYNQKLKNLDDSFANGLKNCKTRSIVTSHNAFNYLGKRYNFEIIPISGLSPDSETSIQDFTELNKIIQQKNIKYVFTETLTSPKTAESIANQTNTKTLILDPIEGLPESKLELNLNYIEIMNRNLSNLRLAMNCS